MQSYKALVAVAGEACNVCNTKVWLLSAATSCCLFQYRKPFTSLVSSLLGYDYTDCLHAMHELLIFALL
jgi:hypothetical protein